MNKVTTTEMSQELRAELIRLGWEKKIPQLPWGRLTSGNASVICMEYGGKHYWVEGPVATVKGGGQIAIVRKG